MNKALRITVIGLGLALAGSAVAQGYGYGPGMMRGYGGGMMGGYGPGAGMMGAIGVLDLKEDQRDKIFAIQDQAHTKNWAAMGELRTAQYKLQRLYAADKVDSNAVVEQQKKVDELRRQLVQAHLETRKQIEAVLTPDQVKQWRRFGPGWGQDAD